MVWLYVLTVAAAKPPKEATPKALKSDEPTTVPIPMSDLVMNVPIKLTKSSGDEVATDIKVAAATSCKEQMERF